MPADDLTFGERNEETDRLLGELMLYVASKSRNVRQLGAVVLNKILWRAEVLCFRNLGEPLTGARYVSLERGPVPDDYRMIRSRLIPESAELTPSPAGGGLDRDVLIPKRNAELGDFSDEQMRLVDQAIDEFDGLTSAEAARASHGLSWEMGNVLGVIPYESFLVVGGPVTDEEKRIAAGLAAELGW